MSIVNKILLQNKEWIILFNDMKKLLYFLILFLLNA